MSKRANMQWWSMLVVSACIASSALAQAPAQPLDQATPDSAGEPSATAASQVAPASTPAQPSIDEAVQAELAALSLNDVGRGDAAVDTSFRLSGFADFGFIGLLVPRDSAWRGAYNRYPAFSVGNFNLYMSRNLTDSLRLFGEVRFTVLPNGAVPTANAATGQYVSTIVADYNDGHNDLRWGGISIERVYLEWIAHRALTLRLGIFLTPYGIWNVDHGSPTIVPVSRPFIIGRQLFPARQTGIEALGQVDVGPRTYLGYHATISNGMGAVSDYRDFDANKALGGRVYLHHDGLGELTIGGSVFYGTDSTAVEVPSLTSDGKHLNYRNQYSSKSDLLSLAADVQWKYRGLLVQSELITQQRRYDERARIGMVNPLSGEFVAPRDRVSWGIYSLLGYRFDWLGVMPYALWQYFDALDPGNVGTIRVHSISLGLNVRPISALVFKLELVQSFFPGGFFISEDPFRAIQAQVATAF